MEAMKGDLLMIRRLLEVNYTL